MSRVLGEHDGEAPLDVPTMMKMLMVVYNNVREDEVMDEVAEALADAICMLGDMRALAQQVASESSLCETEFLTDLASMNLPAGSHKLC